MTDSNFRNPANYLPDITLSFHLNSNTENVTLSLLCDIFDSFIDLLCMETTCEPFSNFWKTFKLFEKNTGIHVTQLIDTQSDVEYSFNSSQLFFLYYYLYNLLFTEDMCH